MRRWIDAFKSSLNSRLIVVLTLITAFYVASGYFLAAEYHWPVSMHTTLYGNVIKMGAMWFIVGFIVYRALYVMLVLRPARPTAMIIKDLRDNYFTPQRLAAGLPVIVIFIIMFSVFTSFKSMIPEIVPFKYDVLFSSLDKTIHFGHQPWEILFPLLSAAIVTTALSFIYKTWFVAKFCTLFWQAFSLKRPLLRERFFITYIIVWIVNGTILAILLSSAGPCFYGFVASGPDPYAPLISFLHESDKILPVWDLFAQDYLWKAYESETIKLFSGISAMPSMHISLSFLFMLLGWQVGRRTGIFFTVYLILMFMGSIHLGWHYAVDGYFGMAMTGLIWWVVGRVLDKTARAPVPATAVA